MPRTIWDELVDNRDPADAGRIAILDRLGILEAGAERAFDDVVQLAGRLFGVHNAAVTFVTGDRIVMNALRGNGVRSSPRERSFSNLVTERDDALVIEDALQDERVAASAVVTGDPHVRFFAGVPIYSGGERLGARPVGAGARGHPRRAQGAREPRRVPRAAQPPPRSS